MARTSSKVIPGEDLKVVDTWRMPTVGGEAEEVNAATGPVTARQIEEIQQQAYEEGFEQGRLEGIQAGQQQIAQRVAELETLMQTLAQPLEKLDSEIEQALVELAMTVARQLVRRELKAAPGEVLGVIREAMGVLPIAARDVRLYMHPEDAELIRSTLSLSEHEQTWQIVEDPVLSRGGCRVATDSSQIDATVENRLNAVIAQVLGGLRENDETGDEPQSE